jgi:ribokinase
VIGSLNADLTMALPRLPRPGETVLGGSLVAGAGGKGANQAVAAGRLGAEVRMVGCVGDDAAGRDLLRRLDDERIGVEGVAVLPGEATGTAVILVDREGRNAIGVSSGANGRLTADMVRAREADIAWAEVLVCQLETPLPAVRWALEAARRRGVATVLNPAPAQPLDDGTLALADYLTPNETEAGDLAGLAVADPESARVAAGLLLARGARRVVVTLGAQGALACDGEQALHFPAFPVDVVDTTGAGDAFNGALAVGLAAGGLLEQAIPLAGAAAALTCTVRGAQAALPDRASVERFLQSLRAR